MSVLSGHAIMHKMIITPFMFRTRDENGLSYGAGPAGYDLRVEFDPFGNQPDVQMGPNTFVLASTIEHFNMPYDYVGIIHDKSTWARQGICVQNTVVEPGWAGYLTLEITNHSGRFITIRRGMPIAQVIFHKVEGYVVPYEGKYQDQLRGPQQAR